jgi:DNA invertase Pin-like site-specific DNA recombinase
MTKAALYARVSTDAQQKEGTIESQLVELKGQIAVAGYELAFASRHVVSESISKLGRVSGRNTV